MTITPDQHIEYIDRLNNAILNVLYEIAEENVLEIDKDKDDVNKIFTEWCEEHSYCSSSPVYYLIMDLLY